MKLQKKPRTQTIGEFSLQKRKVVKLETFYYQGGQWFSLKTGKPERKGK